MKSLITVAAAIGLALSTAPSIARSISSSQGSPAYADQSDGNGGYYVGRYGYGRYVGGPNGGFGGYPAGSAGAQILKQEQQWKCRDVPERC